MNLMIDSSLENLSELEAFLNDVVIEQTIDGLLTPRGRACKDALLLVRGLAVKLAAVKATREGHDRQLQFCEMCDD